MTSFKVKFKEHCLLIFYTLGTKRCLVMSAPRIEKWPAKLEFRRMMATLQELIPHYQIQDWEITDFHKISKTSVILRFNPHDESAFQ